MTDISSYGIATVLCCVDVLSAFCASPLVIPLSVFAFCIALKIKKMEERRGRREDIPAQVNNIWDVLVSFFSLEPVIGTLRAAEENQKESACRAAQKPSVVRHVGPGRGR